MAKLNEIEGLDAALAEAKTKAKADGIAEGYADGRKDATAIMEAAGHAGPAFAAKLAGNPAMSVEDAKGLMAAVPEPKPAAAPGAAYQQRLAAVSPDVGPNTPPASEAAAREARVAQLTEIGKMARKI